MNRSTLGFTLIEMSLTLLVLSILIVGGINFQMATVNNSRQNITLDRMNRVERAIDEYVLLNGRLPCPASPLVTLTTTSFGNEACSGATSAYISGNIIYGAVPIRVLGLTTDQAIDGWGSTIAYLAYNSYTVARTFISGGGSAIVVNNLNGDLVTNKAIYLLISPGENKNGAFRNGSQGSITSSLKDSVNAYTSSFTNSFIKDVTTDLFDDIVYYKEKSVIALDTNREELSCSLSELSSLGTEWTNSSHSSCPNGICQQGTEILASTACPSGKISKNPVLNSSNLYVPARKCLKYGQWSDIMYPCEDGCDVSNINNVTGGGFTTTGQLYANIDPKYLKRAASGEEITLQCISTKTGYITLLCQSDGDWLYSSGKCVNKTDAL